MKLGLSLGVGGLVVGYHLGVHVVRLAIREGVVRA